MPLQNWNDLLNLPTTLSEIKLSKSDSDSDLKHDEMTNSSSSSFLDKKTEFKSA